MESWKQGRCELFNQLKVVYDQIGENIASELNNDKHTRISIEDLRKLRETSASVHRIVESHARLTDELEIAREAVAKVEDLEKENKRLANELQKRLKPEPIQISVPNPRLHNAAHRDLTPVSSEPPSSVAQVEPGETKQVTQKKYEELVKYYTQAWQRLEAMKGAKEAAETIAKNEQTKRQEWGLWVKNMNEKVEKRGEKIKKLKEEIVVLKSKLGEEGEEMAASFASNQEPEKDEIVQDVCPIVSKFTNTEVQVAASSPPRVPRPRVLDDISKAFASASKANEGRRKQDETQMELPVLPDEDHVGDTSFEPLEAHHTSSTEGDSDPVLPEISAGANTEAEPEPEPAAPSSPAVFVSTRSVKKRKSRGQNPDEASGPKVKIEVVELSSPHTPILGTYLNVGESMDLDDIGEKVSTPRKAHHVALASQDVARVMAGSQKSGRSSSHSQAQSIAPVEAVNTPVRSETSVLQPRSINTKILPRTSEDTGRALKKRKVASNRAVSDITEDGEATPINRGSKAQLVNKTDQLLDLLSKPSPDRLVISPPQSRSTVRPSTSILSALQKSTSKRSSASTSALAHELLGSTPRKELEVVKSNTVESKPKREPTPISRPLSARASHEPADTTAPKRITASMLEASRPVSGQVPRSSAESFKPSSGISSTSSKEPSFPDEDILGREETPVPGTQLPARRDLASAFISRTTTEVAKSSPRTPTISRPGMPVTLKRKQIQTEADYEMDPDQEPLRARPLSKLGLKDFKVNPKYNHGYEFAYREVVRGKDARAAMEGCIKPECCGPIFRAVAKTELEIRPETSSQEDRDLSLLKDYLGFDAARIQNMGVEEREEMLIQAKTREIANKNGRHRHAYERGASPTGFWRTDFPTSQEEKEDREKEREKERVVVEQRYRQAMREGGAYVFRDE